MSLAKTRRVTAFFKTNVRGPAAVTKAVLHGTLGVATLLTMLLIISDLTTFGHLKAQTYIGVFIASYLHVAFLLLRRSRHRTASWMVIVLFELLVFYALLYWGVGAPSTLLLLAFILILPGALLGAKYLFPLLGISIAQLVTAYTVHALGIRLDSSGVFPMTVPLIDLVTFIALLSLSSLVLWLSQNQTELATQHAKAAEKRLRKQRETVSAELRQESAILRQTRLKQNHQLYQFAQLGQSSAAMLHELSNLLSILNLDINDIEKNSKASQAINNAQGTIAHINKTVRIARRQLQSTTSAESFNIVDTISTCVDDVSQKFAQRGVRLEKMIKARRSILHTHGSAMALLQIVTILLNNALDACQDLDNAKVCILVTSRGSDILVTVADTGPGIDRSARADLFHPKPSTKPTGLGLGLYIARQLAKTHLNGSLDLIDTDTECGAQFLITLPKPKRRYSN